MLLNSIGLFFKYIFWFRQRLNMNNHMAKCFENEVCGRGNLQNRHVLIYRQSVVKTTNVVFFR